MPLHLSMSPSLLQEDQSLQTFLFQSSETWEVEKIITVLWRMYLWFVKIFNINLNKTDGHQCTAVSSSTWGILTNDNDKTPILCNTPLSAINLQNIGVLRPSVHQSVQNHSNLIKSIFHHPHHHSPPSSLHPSYIHFTTLKFFSSFEGHTELC